MPHSNLSFAVLGHLSKYKKTTQELADVCKYPEAEIHRWRYGFNTVITPKQISKLARAFATSPKDIVENHLNLLYAHLRDECTGLSAKYINLEILTTALPIVAGSWCIYPSRRRSELDMVDIKKHIWYDPNLQKTIRDIARPLKRKPIPKWAEDQQKSKTPLASQNPIQK